MGSLWFPTRLYGTHHFLFHYHHPTHFRFWLRPFRSSAHYAEYLVRLINERGLDPAALYGAAELRAAAERHLPAGRPPQGDNENDAEYAARLRELLAREAPVEPRPSRPSPAP